MTETTEAMRAEARRWDAENNATAHTAPWDCFADGMAHAAELIGKMVKADEDRPAFVITIDGSLRGPTLGERSKREAEMWEAQLEEAKKNAPPPLSERITNGEWLK